jgi:hypothetical protein
MDDSVKAVVGRRATISFTPRAVTDLDWLTKQTGFNQTDVANRAVQIYAMIERGLAEEKKLAFVDSEGTVERIAII